MRDPGQESAGVQSLTTRSGVVRWDRDRPEGGPLGTTRGDDGEASLPAKFRAAADPCHAPSPKWASRAGAALRRSIFFPLGGDYVMAF